ncbi:MAG: aspartyl/asparaginyl beta-hydroxylase domain-containing protein [Novosphingobium sp.]
MELTQYQPVKDSPAVWIGKRLRRPLNRWLAGQSLIGRQPFVDERQVPGIAALKENWETILAEARAVMVDRQGIPSFGDISPDHRRIAQNSAWKSYFFHGYGYRVKDNCQRCPKTAALIDQVPNVMVAFFSIFEPGTHIRDHYGVTKAMLNVHLGLIVPPEEDRCELRVRDTYRRWKPGEFLIFDETFNHEAWNESSEPRVVLFLQVMRPMRWPGRLLGKMFLWGIKQTTYVQQARQAIGAA